MRTSIAWMVLVGSLAVGLGAVGQSAHADSFSTAAGMQSELGHNCFQFGVFTPGANKIESPECFGNQFIMPLYWRTFSGAAVNRTVTVRGKVMNGSLLGCSLFAYNSSGTLVSQATSSFSNATENFQNISLTVNNITSTGSSFVACSGIGAGTFLMKVDYSP